MQNQDLVPSRPRPPRSPRPQEPPFKRLVVAADGTWLNSDDGNLNGELAIPSNVTRLSRAIRSISRDGIPQIVYYQSGVGAEGGVLDRVIGGATGQGLAENVREAYSFISNNYSPGDEIFLIGFSRGAFTARSIAGLIGAVGVLTKKGLPALPEIFRDAKHQHDRHYRPRNPDVPFPNKPSAGNPRYAEELERRGMTILDVPVKAIGVWDTVGALGLPRVGWLTRVGLQPQESKEMSFYDTKLSNCIENAFQALALDERRSAFSPAVWEKPRGNYTTLRQVWFPGVHSNVGGGYDDQELANITLAWMMSQLEPFLDMNLDFVLQQDRENVRYYERKRKRIRPWSFGKIYDSLEGIYTLSGGTTRTPGQYYAVDPSDGRTTDRPLRDTHEYIHPSVRTRIRLKGPGVEDEGRYDPEAMDDWKPVVEYNDDSDRPDVYWKARYADMPNKVLPESPLWGVERALAETDPETYEYVRFPPPTRNRVPRDQEGRPERAPSRGPPPDGRGQRPPSRRPTPQEDYDY